MFHGKLRPWIGVVVKAYFNNYILKKLCATRHISFPKIDPAKSRTENVRCVLWQVKKARARFSLSTHRLFADKNINSNLKESFSSQSLRVVELTLFWRFSSLPVLRNSLISCSSSHNHPLRLVMCIAHSSRSQITCSYLGVAQYGTSYTPSSSPHAPLALPKVWFRHWRSIFSSLTLLRGEGHILCLTILLLIVLKVTSSRGVGWLLLAHA